MKNIKFISWYFRFSFLSKWCNFALVLLKWLNFILLYKWINVLPSTTMQMAKFYFIV